MTDLSRARHRDVMRLNGSNGGVLLEHQIEEGEHHDDNMDEMLATERGGMASRVSDLERKVLEQGDELVCLRATLADVLRRLNLLEGLRGQHNGTGAATAPTTPVRNGYGSQGLQGIQRTGGIISPSGNKEIRLRQPQIKRGYSHNSSLPQRRAVHYQSTGSLHSDSQSSSSVSPIPSPSPRSTPLPTATTPNGARPTPIARTTSVTNNNGSLQHAKRWSSTGDFNHSKELTAASPVQSR